MAQKVFVDPIKYAVGKDITSEQYNEAVQKIGDWFAQKRSTKEPVAAAKLALEECLDGVTKDGKPWFAMALAPLASRIRSKCSFDITTMTPLLKATDKQKLKKTKEKLRAQAKRKQGYTDKLMPDELREEARRKGLHYGDEANLRFTAAEEQYWREVRAGYLQEFPHLDSVNASSELDHLCDLAVMQSRNRMRMLSGEAVSPLERTAVVDDIAKLKKALGIHPEQLKNKVQAKIETSIGAAAAKLQDLKEFRKIRLQFFAEQMIQMFQMAVTPSADGLGMQLDEWELFGMTKCRTCHCAKCGHRNFVGFSMDEIRTELVERGYLRPTGEIRSRQLPVLDTPPPPDPA